MLKPRNDELISKEEFEELSQVDFYDLPDELKKFVGTYADVDIVTISALRYDDDYIDEDRFDGSENQKEEIYNILEYHGVTVYDMNKIIGTEPKMLDDDDPGHCEYGKCKADKDCEQCYQFYDCLIEGRDVL